MKIESNITISKSELISIIKEKYHIIGDFDFKIKEETIESGWCDGVQFYTTYHVFDSMKIKNVKTL